VVLLCVATNPPWVWRTTLEMTMGVLPCLNSLVQAVREGDFAHTCIHSTVEIPSVIFVAGVLVATCVGMMLAYHGSACDDHFWKHPCVQSRAFCLSLSVSGAGHHSSAE